MQAYVYKEGKNLGPYTVSELRDRVENGSLLGDDLACHDGQNWVKIIEVPGFRSSNPPPPPPPPPFGGTSSQPPGSGEGPSATERAKAVAGSLLDKSREGVAKIAGNEKVSKLKDKASDVSSKIKSSETVQRAKSKITSSKAFRKLGDKFKGKDG